MKYYNTTNICTLLFDDKLENIEGVAVDGFPGVQVSLEKKGISPDELKKGMKLL